MYTYERVSLLDKDTTRWHLLRNGVNIIRSAINYDTARNILLLHYCDVVCKNRIILHIFRCNRVLFLGSQRNLLAISYE